jgi:pimeloyl-ACP methyl ester carboxylesterase
VAGAAGDVGVLADGLDLKQFAVLGVSGGGPHALACAALLPERVTRVAVLVGTAPSDDPEFDALAGMNDLNVRGVTAARTSPEAYLDFLRPYVDMIKQNPETMIDTLAAEVPDSDQAVLARADVRARLRKALASSYLGRVASCMARPAGSCPFDLPSPQGQSPGLDSVSRNGWFRAELVGG